MYNLQSMTTNGVKLMSNWINAIGNLPSVFLRNWTRIKDGLVSLFFYFLCVSLVLGLLVLFTLSAEIKSNELIAEQERVANKYELSELDIQYCDTYWKWKRCMLKLAVERQGN